MVDEEEREKMGDDLRRSEAIFRKFFEVAQEGIAILDADTQRIIYANPALQRLTGRTLEQLIGKELWEIESFEDVDRNQIGSQLREKEYVRIEPLPIKAREKGSISAEFVTHTYEVNGKKVIQCNIRDITERKRAEEALRESEQRLRRITDNMLDMVVETDLQGICKYASPSVKAILGYDPKNLVGKSLFDFVHPEDLGTVTETIQRAISTDRLWTGGRFECRYRHVDGHYVWLENLANMVYDEKGQMIGGVIGSRDITERKRAEDALRRRVEELAALQATVLDITSQQELSTLLYAVVERSVQLLMARSGGMYMCDLGRKEVRLTVSYKTSRDFTGTVLKYGEGAAGIVAQTRKPVIINDYRKWQGRALVFEEESPFTAVLSVPMIWQGRVVGVIDVMDDGESRRFTKEDQELLTLFANHAAIAVQRQQTEQKLRLQSEITENMFEGVVLARGSDGVIVYTNPRFEQMFGYGSGELIGKNITTVNAPVEGKSPGDVTREIEASLNESGAWVGEVHNVKKDGTPFWCRVNTSTLESSEYGRISVSVQEDITERKNMEEELRRYSSQLEQQVAERTRDLAASKDFAENLIQTANAIVVGLDNHGNVRFFNQAAERITGYTGNEVEGHNWFEVIVPRDRYPEIWREVERLTAGGLPKNFENPILTKSGEERYIVWQNSEVREQGQLVGTISFGIDITERKRAEEQLRTTRGRLEYAIASNPAVIYTGKPLADYSDFVLTYVNDRVVEMLGFEPREFIGHPEFWLGRVHPDDLHRYPTEVRMLWKMGQYTFEYRFRHKDGTYRWIREEAKVVHDADGKPIEVNGYWTDVTERKRLEEALVKSQRLAAIGETSAMVGHDLRNPLQGIAGIVYLAKRNLESRKAADRKAAAGLLDTIQEQVVYMDKIVSDLQDYAQPLKPRLVETNLPNLVKETLSTIKIPQTVKVSIKVEKDAQNVMIDPTLMRRTFTNLVMNAVQAMPKGGKLTVRARSKWNSTIMTVEDTGEGIPKKNLTKLFSPFFTTRAKGQGLGLAVCKRLVEVQGGTITVKSKQRKSTIFTIKIPRSKKQEAR